MSSETRTLDDVKEVILSAHKNLSPAEKVEFYNTWAEDYDKVSCWFGKIDTIVANSLWECVAECVANGWFKQPHLAQSDWTLGLGEAAG